MRRINSIFTPQDLSFSFASPSQARHASNLVAQYRERQAAGDTDAGPLSSTGGKSRGCIRFFLLLPFHPRGILPGCHNEPLVAKQWRVLKHRSLQSYHFWVSFFVSEVCKSDLVRNAPKTFLGRLHLRRLRGSSHDRTLLRFFKPRPFPSLCHCALGQDTSPTWPVCECSLNE